MSGLDPQYVADAVAWAVAWSGLGLVGRKLLAEHDVRQAQRAAADRRKVKR